MSDYDRELIASMLESAANGRTGYKATSMREQAELLRAADNADAARVGAVVRTPQPVTPAGDVPFATVREVVKALTKLGTSTPESQEEQAARAVELVGWLCREVHSHFDELSKVTPAGGEVVLVDEPQYQALVRDAERYRWLRRGLADSKLMPDAIAQAFADALDSNDCTKFDAAIDAALNQRGGGVCE